jgi:hypothetical protein
MMTGSHRANLKFKLTQRIYMMTLNTTHKTLILTLSSILMMGCAGMSEQEKATATSRGQNNC